MRIEPSLDPSRRYCRPWTRDFVQDISEVYYNSFHEQIQLNSAVRTVKVQKKLRRHNRNAAPAEGETASSHLAGITVDLQRRGMTKEQIRFMERYLFYLNASAWSNLRKNAATGASTSWSQTAMKTGGRPRRCFRATRRTKRSRPWAPRTKRPFSVAASRC